MHPKRRPYLRLVTSDPRLESGAVTAPVRANGTINEATNSLRVSTVRLEGLSSSLAAAATGLRESLSGLAEIERKLAASHLRAIEVAAEAATLESHIRDASLEPAGEISRHANDI